MSPAEFPGVDMTKPHKSLGSPQLYSFLMVLEAQSLKSRCSLELLKQRSSLQRLKSGAPRRFSRLFTVAGILGVSWLGATSFLSTVTFPLDLSSGAPVYFA